MYETLNSWWTAFLDITYVRKLTRMLDRLWVRIAALGILSLIAIATARLTDRFIPDFLDGFISVDEVKNLLEIIANSMLAITIFSLSVMVTVFRAASSQWTPRVHRLMLDDRTTQNTLATFLGAYIFALTSIILIDTEVFEEDQIVVLFVFLVAIVILILMAIVNWITHLQTLGSLIEVTRRIETQAAAAFQHRMEKPCLGANALRSEDDIPTKEYPYRAYKTGYIQHIYEGALSEIAEEADTDIYITAPIGKFVFEGDPILYFSKEIEDVDEKIRSNLSIGDLRTFEQDPRFGLIVLGEIGSKALSPGINDPGTAIDVLGRMGRIFEGYADEMDKAMEDMPHPRLWVPPLQAADMIEDGFDPIARDGGSIVEVQLMLQKVLADLADHPDETLAKAAEEAAKRAFSRAEKHMKYGDDLERLKKVVPAEVSSQS